MKYLRRWLAVLAALSLVAALVAGCGAKPAGEQKKEEPKAVEKKFVNIATGGTAGVYYPLGGAIAEILTRNVPGVNASAQSTGASVANVNALKDGSAHLAFMQNDIAYYAANGAEMFKDKKVDGLKALATLYPETIQVVTLEKFNIKDIAGLKGKRVAVGAAGSGTEANARQILEAYGITYKDIKAQYLSFADAANNLKDGNIDAAFVTAGFPTAAIQDIAAQHKVVLLPVSSEAADKLIKQYPFYTKITVPANTYPNQGREVSALAVRAMLVVTDKMDAQMAYDITKTIYGNLDRIQSAHAVGKSITKASARDGMSVPLHAGAEKFFKE